MKLSKSLLQTLQYPLSVAIIFPTMSHPAVWQTYPVTSCRLFRSAYRPRWFQGHWYACSAAHKLTQDDMSASLQLVTLTDSGPLSTSSLICIDVIPILSPDDIPGDLDDVEMDEWRLPYGRWWCSAIHPCSIIWQWSQCFVSTTLRIVGRGWGASSTFCKVAESASRCG